MARLIGWLCLALFALAPAAAAAADWRAAETEHFIIYTDQSDKDLEKMATRLEKMDGLLRMATGISDEVEPVKVRIYVVDDTAAVGKAVGQTGSGILGFYTSNIFGPFAVTPAKTPSYAGGFDADMVLYHEYAHHFMLQYFPASYPQWYVEGFAELIGSSKFLPDGRIGYGMPAKHRGDHLAFAWAPLQEVLMKPAHKVHNFDLYGQGWAITHYLTFSDERAPQMRQYLTALTQGKSPEEAAKAFGNISKLNQDAAKYLRAGSFAYKPVDVKIEEPVIRRVRPLSAGEAALIPEIIAFRDESLGWYRKEGDKKRALEFRERNLADIRSKAAIHANDPFALHLLGEAEYAAGNYAAAEAAADRLLALKPDHVRGRVRKALAMLQNAPAAERAGRADEARKLVLAANRDNPDDVLPLVGYYQTFNLAGEQAPEQAVNGLAAAVQTLPGDERIRQMMVDEMAAQKKWRYAIAYLAPLANSPHETPMRDAARKQMEELEAELAKETGATPAAS
ncbi:MAG: hypothetical protein ACK40O_12640 [Allosphingosinicella sp.]